MAGILGEEVDRLPAKYRCPIELCYLQGLTYHQAARQLNWPVATVKGRLVRGRLKLRERLARRSLARRGSGVPGGSRVKPGWPCHRSSSIPQYAQ